MPETNYVQQRIGFLKKEIEEREKELEKIRTANDECGDFLVENTKTEEITEESDILSLTLSTISSLNAEIKQNAHDIQSIENSLKSLKEIHNSLDKTVFDEYNTCDGTPETIQTMIDEGNLRVSLVETPTFAFNILDNSIGVNILDETATTPENAISPINVSSYVNPETQELYSYNVADFGFDVSTLVLAGGDGQDAPYHIGDTLLELPGDYTDDWWINSFKTMRDATEYTDCDVYVAEIGYKPKNENADSYNRIALLYAKTIKNVDTSDSLLIYKAVPTTVNQLPLADFKTLTFTSGALISDERLGPDATSATLQDFFEKMYVGYHASLLETACISNAPLYTNKSCTVYGSTYLVLDENALTGKQLQNFEDAGIEPSSIIVGEFEECPYVYCGNPD